VIFCGPGAFAKIGPSFPIMTKYSTWTALRNPVFRQLWIASVISGTCVAAHDGAATWMMNKLTGSPFLISLMSTVASLSFFLFTLPAGVLADKVESCFHSFWTVIRYVRSAPRFHDIPTGDQPCRGCNASCE
jgi:hypothetical protein